MNQRSKAEAIAARALKAGPAERRALLAAECDGDEQLHALVERLLASKEPSDSLAGTWAKGPAEDTGGRSSQPALREGTRLGHYEIVGLLGRGGMGEVYRARDSKLARDVAIKVLPEHRFADPEARDRFEREARAIAALSHPNILTIHDFGEEEGLCYAVMEVLEGSNLAEALAKSGGFTLPETVRIGTELARGLAQAHAAGFVHRDIKPANLFLRQDGRVTILDFGLAHSIAPGLAEIQALETLPGGMTTPGTVLGTLGYMSPEQARGEKAGPASDLFSLGCVLYEMATGQSPFKRTSAGETLAAILDGDPVPVSELTSGPGVAALEQIVDRCLAKDPNDRYASASDLEADLMKLAEPGPSILPRSVVGRASVVIGVLAVLASVGFWLSTRDPEGRWAREEGLPQLFELSEAEEYFEAFLLARRIEEILPGDPLLAQAWDEIGFSATIESEPPGASFSFATMAGGEWIPMGTTPLTARFPIGRNRARIELDGFETMEGSCCGPGGYRARLLPSGTVPPGTLPIPGGMRRLALRGMPAVQGTTAPAFLGKFEVTNREFAEFVDAGAYDEPSHWPSPLVDGAQTLSFEEAMARFRDSTGQAGPASWEFGRYPDGQEDYPVQGVSWYEAEAYARFVGGSLPTVFHWNKASGTHAAGSIIRASNIDSEAPLPVGSMPGIGGLGHYDVAGNVREWCRNPTPDGRRFILGGGYSEPDYAFYLANAIAPMDRSLINGLRLLREIDDQPSPADANRALPTVDLTAADLEAPGPPPGFVDQWRDLVAYDRGDLETDAEEVPAELVSWAPKGETGRFVVERVSFNAAYGGERMEAFLFFPRKAQPPYQAVIHYPGETMSAPKLVPGLLANTEYLVRSGRVLVFPVYRSIFSRQDGLTSAVAEPGKGQEWQARIVMWTKDVMRTLDFLETRDDIDMERVGYHGASWGHWMATWILPVENRIRAALLRDGGAPSAYVHALVPDTFLGRYPNSHKPLLAEVTIPVLMLNGRYDHLFPVDTTQEPFFEALGTPAENKRHRVFDDAGHMGMPLPAAIREGLAFFDRYLGEVDQEP